MPITYATTSITAIANGDAITADILNAPSVSLATRTVEIKRNADYDNFSRGYTSDSLVKLTPTLQAAASTLTVTTQTKSDEGENAGDRRRYYSASLTGAALSVYSKALPGGRYVVSSAKLSSFFSDSVKANLNILSNYLVTPGDGVYLKVPLRNVSVGENLSNYPDGVAPKTMAQALDNGYLTSTGPAYVSADANLVKLPSLTKVTILGITAADLLSGINSSQFFGDNGISITATLNSEGDLAIEVDSDSSPLTLRLGGIHKSWSVVTNLVTSGSDCIATVIAESGPIFRHTDESTPLATGLVCGLYDATDTLFNLEDATLLNGKSHLIKPADLDPRFSYVPIIRLTETTLEVGDKSISLIANYDELNSQVQLLDLHGAPISGIPTTDSTKDLEVDLLDKEPPLSLGKHTIRLSTPTVTAPLLIQSVSDTNNLLVHKLKSKVASGNTLSLHAVRYYPISGITTEGSLDNLELKVAVLTTGLTPSKLMLGSFSSVTLPAAAIVDYGSTIELLPESSGAPVVVGNASLTGLSIAAWIVESAAANVTAGKFYVEVDLVLS